jgi:hypothetical protein
MLSDVNYIFLHYIPLAREQCLESSSFDFMDEF